MGEGEPWGSPFSFPERGYEMARGAVEKSDGRAMLASARRIVRRLVDDLEDDIDRLSAQIGEATMDDRKALVGQTRELNRALMTLLELEGRWEDRDLGFSDGALDLEAARAEIESRLARLVSAGAAGVR